MTKPRRWRLRIAHDGRLCAWAYEDPLGGTPAREDCITDADVESIARAFYEHDRQGLRDIDWTHRVEAIKDPYRAKARTALSTIFKDGET